MTIPKELRTKIYLRPTTAFCKRLGKHINIARRRRRFSQQEMADKTGISRATYQRLEKGDSSVSISALVKVLFVLDGLHSFDELLAPEKDRIGMGLAEDALPQRVHPQKIEFTGRLPK